VAGFTGVFVGANGAELTTLGRGASDTTAVALAAALKADACEILTDVEGVYSADPRLVPTARKHAAICYDAMLELAGSGAKVLHTRAVEMAKRYSVPLYVGSSMTEAVGTWIREGKDVEKLNVSGLAQDRNVAMVTVHGLDDCPGSAYRVLEALAAAGINVDIIQTTPTGIIFTVHRSDADKAVAALGNAEVTVDANMAKLAVVGAGMATNHGVAAAILGALYESGVNISLIATSEIKIAVLVHEKDIPTAVKAVHDKFEGEIS
jgi:aspartate kinase